MSSTDTSAVHLEECSADIIVGTASTILEKSRTGLSVDIKRQNVTDVDLPQLRRLPGWMKWFWASVCLVTGLLSTYAFKIMNRVEVPPCEGCPPRYFTGSCIQVFFMFLGEILCGFVWFVDSRLSAKKNKMPYFHFARSRHVLQQERLRYWWAWAFPPFCDFLGTGMAAIAMQITYASTVQMLRNFLVVVTAATQILVIRKALKVNEYIGVALIAVALVLAAIPAVLYPEEATSQTGEASVGIILALVGTSIAGFQITLEDFLMRKTLIPPSKAVGFEGFFGLIYITIFMPIADRSGLEKVWESWYQLGQSGVCIGWVVAYIFIALIFNVSGLATTRLASGLLRSVIYALRAPIAWIIDLSLTWLLYDSFNLASVIVFAVGFVIYCRMFELPGKVGQIYRMPIHCGKFTNPELDNEGGLEVEQAGADIATKEASFERYGSRHGSAVRLV